MQTLRHITIISNDGLTIYHKTFGEVFDEILFSGLAGAFLAFSKELEDELSAIVMKNQTIHFKSLQEGVIIVSVDSGTDWDNIQMKITKLSLSFSLQVMLSNAANGIILQEYQEFEQEVMQTFGIEFDLTPSMKAEETQNEQVPDPDIDRNLFEKELMAAFENLDALDF